uniref:Ig-like domain-containing protein n=1 Tax=Terrapene triunguis TaxID=2587831 RepID=A0A674JYI6_9SAUR
RTAGSDRPLSYPKPNISVSLGGTVVVRCWGQHQDVRFVLNKERRHFPPVDSDGFEAVFSSSNVHRDLGGSYSCSYHSKSEPFAVSYPSDPVELVVRGEGPALASPFPAPPPPARPSPGRSSCLVDTALGWDPGDLAQLLVQPQTLCDGSTSRFSKVSSLAGGGGLKLGGSQAESPQTKMPTDIGDLYPSLPRPSISLSPTGVTAPGADVTIRCQGQRRDMRFFLHKTGDLNPQRHMDPAGARAEFRIPSVSRQHGGSYSCSYRPRSEPFVSSQPSDTVELVVAGEGPSSVSPLPPLGCRLGWEGLGGNRPVAPDTHGCCCFPGGSESPALPGLASPIITGDSPGPSEGRHLTGCPEP